MSIAERMTQRLNMCYSKSNHLQNLDSLSIDCPEKWKISHTIGISVFRISNSLFDWLWLNWPFKSLLNDVPLRQSAWEIISIAFETHSFFHPNFQHNFKTMHLATRNLLGNRLSLQRVDHLLRPSTPLQSGTSVAYCERTSLISHFHSFNL